jgi:type IV secretion system protein VirB10
MPGVDFEHESRIAESVVRPRGGRPGRLVGILLTGCAIASLGYAWYVSTLGPRNAPKNNNEAFNTARAGVTLGFDAPEPKADNRLKLPPVPAPVVAPPIVAPPAPPPMPVVVDDSEARRKAEEERLRREAEARENARLRSAMLVLDVANGAPSGLGGANESAGPVKVQGPEEDANRRFLANAQDVETAHAHKIARIDALVPQGSMIRATLETAIQSDLPGMVKAITREDVYSFDGRRVLIPSGTMLTGEYRSALTRGQTRVFVIWTRLLRADGISLSLGSYGTDSLGRSGLPGEVDEHYFERFGSSILLSIVGGGSAFLAGLNSTGQSTTAAAGTGTSVGLQAQTQAQQTASQTFSDLANQALKDSINIPPTIYVDQGTRIIVFVKRDLDFSEWYPDPVKEALYELRHPHPAQQSGNPVGSSADVSPALVRAYPSLAAKP